MPIDPTVMLWPDQLLPETIGRGRSHPINQGPEVISGPPQTVIADAGRHRFTFERIPLFGLRVLTFRAVIAELTSPLLPVYVPIADRERTPRALAFVSPFPGVTFSDSATFSDATRFYDQPVDFQVTTSAVARASSLTLTRIGPPNVALWAGNYIGIGERAYIVKKIWDSADGVEGHYDVTIWPYLRAAVAAGDDVWTEEPVVKCVIDPKSAEAAEKMQYDRLGFVDLDFIEYRW